MREQRLFVCQQQIVAGIKLVFFRQAKIGTEEIGHRAVAEPFAMQSPLAARRNQPVGREHLQDLIPWRSFPARRQPIGPESIKLKLLPQLPAQPAAPPFPPPPTLHLPQPTLT